MEPEEGREGIHITRKWFGQHCYFSLNILHLSLDIALHGIVVIQHALCFDSALSRLWVIGGGVVWGEGDQTFLSQSVSHGFVLPSYLQLSSYNRMDVVLHKLRKRIFPCKWSCSTQPQPPLTDSGWPMLDALYIAIVTVTFPHSSIPDNCASSNILKIITHWEL